MTEQYFLDMASRARMGGIYLYTDFCTMAEADMALSKTPKDEILLWGGATFCERVMIRFGSEIDKGFASERSDFPITLLRIAPKQQKFADRLSHRDFLGALMNLGLSRDVLGDIVCSENVGYVFTAERIAPLLIDELKQVKHTAVICETISELPENAAPKIIEEDVNIASKRLDGIIAKVFRLSRNEAKGLFSAEKIFVNGHLTNSPGDALSEGAVVSVHGHGKFVFYGISGETKKGRIMAKVGRYS